ncbi:MAG: hypothetical protein IJT28_09535 [Bacteroidaceae bacterium]|nr:hypothetical protein [Bacteroidaceae bacterium]
MGVNISWFSLPSLAGFLSPDNGGTEGGAKTIEGMGVGLDIIEAKYNAADEPFSPSTTTSDLRRLIASASRFASADEANCFSSCSRSKT